MCKIRRSKARVRALYDVELSPFSENDGPQLNPVTVNPVIRMFCLGPFICPRDSEAFPSNSEPGAYNPLF